MKLHALVDGGTTACGRRLVAGLRTVRVKNFRRVARGKTVCRACVASLRRRGLLEETAR